MEPGTEANLADVLSDVGLQLGDEQVQAVTPSDESLTVEGEGNDARILASNNLESATLTVRFALC